jgi:uncharacterized membrane protein
MKQLLSYEIRWHVLLVHFPVSLFATAFGFQLLHLFVASSCFTLASNVVMLAATTIMVPTAISGWSSWKRNYKSAKTTLFKRKITTAFIILGVGILLTGWRLIFFGFNQENSTAVHWIFWTVSLFLVLASIVEGYYGGKLHHGERGGHDMTGQ